MEIDHIHDKEYEWWNDDDMPHSSFYGNMFVRIQGAKLGIEILLARTEEDMTKILDVDKMVTEIADDMEERLFSTTGIIFKKHYFVDRQVSRKQFYELQEFTMSQVVKFAEEYVEKQIKQLDEIDGS